MMSRKKPGLTKSGQPRCGKCVHAGEHFRIPGGTHLHCKHPVESVRDTPPYGTGWGTLRRWTDSCSAFEPVLTKAKAQACEALLDYSAGVSFEEWGADADAPECQLCHRCDMMFLRSLVTECAQCFDSLCSACADGHADEHKPNDELAHR